jgi:hypothetical protein
MAKEAERACGCWCNQVAVVVGRVRLALSFLVLTSLADLLRNETAVEETIRVRHPGIMDPGSPLRCGRNDEFSTDQVFP